MNPQPEQNGAPAGFLHQPGQPVHQLLLRRGQPPHRDRLPVRAGDQQLRPGREPHRGSLGTHSYNAANQLTDPGYTYDGEGNLTATAAGLTAAYNPAGQTTSITAPGGSPIALTYAGTTQSELLTAGGTSYPNSWVAAE